MVIRRVCGIVVTVYVAMILVVPSRLILMLATVFLAVVRVRRFAVHAVADHARLLTPVCTIAAKLAKFRDPAAARINERMPTMVAGVVVLVAVEAERPVFSEGISASGG